jgi:predicted nucleic acid-binding protein
VTLILDTGPIVAALDASDPDHAACAGLLRDSDDLVVPALVLVEVDY